MISARAGSRARRRCRPATRAPTAATISSTIAFIAGILARGAELCSPRQPLERDGRPGWERALALGDQRQRIGPEQRGDQMRALRPGRRRPRPVLGVADAGRGSPARAPGCESTGVSSRPRVTASGRRRPRRASIAGRAKRTNVTTAETGLPGRPKTSVPPARPNQVGLPGCSATRQNTSSTPSAASAGLTWSCGPTDTPPETSTTSDSAERRRQAPRVVASRSSASRRARAASAPAAAGEGGEHRPVGVVDLARARAARRARGARRRCTAPSPAGGG